MSEEVRFQEWMTEARGEVEEALRAQMATYEGVVPQGLVDAMSYSLLAGGKRLRPLLVMAAAEAFGANSKDKAVMSAAVAVEMIHTYSLIHDDLPSMDDDDMRRGRPTNHRAFGEALALLAGDGLLTEAFGVVANGDEPCRARLCALFSKHAGALGMVGGQVDDTVSPREDTAAFLDRINRRKTGDLLALSCAAGACAGGASSDDVKRLQDVGYLMGLAFQQWDDVLDVTGDATLMGKSTGNDEKQHKPTYPKVMGLKATEESAHQRILEAKDLLKPLMPRAWKLCELADAMVDRKH